MRSAALFLSLVLATPAMAQQVIPSVPADQALADALAQPGLIVDGVSTWPVDWDRVPPADLLVQIVYASAAGGNATQRAYRIVTPGPTGWILGAPFDLPGNGIRDVQTHPQGALLTQFLYQAGDPRCCPSGTVTTVLSRGIP